jgi:putative oxidoreductase
MTLIRRIARPLLASTFFVGAANALQKSEPLSEKAQPVTDRIVEKVRSTAPQVPIPSDPQTLVRVNAAVQIAAAAALATNRAPRLSSKVLAASLVPTTLVGHRFWEETDPAAKNLQRLQFAKNLSVLGGLILAAVDTEGRPGVAWRAQRAARDLRREAGHLGSEAKLEARLAAAKVR